MNRYQDVAIEQLKREIIDHYQHDFPLTPSPYRVIAEQLNTTEDRVIEALGQLQDDAMVSRVGPVFCHRRSGASTLAALSVPETRLEAVAALVNRFPEINHNYAREHDYNLWFVVTAPDQKTLASVLRTIAQETGLEPLDLPMEQAYHIDLGFPIQWN